MTTAPDDHFRPFLHLLSVGVVGGATAAVFFGVAFLWLAPPRPTEPPADLDAQTQALEVQEVSPPANNDTAWGSSAAPAADNVARSPTSRAPPNRNAPVLEATVSQTALVPPARATRARRVRVVWHQRQVAVGSHGAASWRPDARAGPLPGGGFYGPPNVNAGYIDPR